MKGEGTDLTETHPLDWEKIKTLKDLKAIFQAINIKFTKTYAKANGVDKYLKPNKWKKNSNATSVTTKVKQHKPSERTKGTSTSKTK